MEKSFNSQTAKSLDTHILCRDLFKIYKIKDIEVVALRGLDLNVEAGEMIGIVGPSGSGKTTLLNVLAGFEVPSAGNVSVSGYDLLNFSREKLLEYRRNSVGFLWQQTSRNLFPFLTADENVELPLILVNKPRNERLTRVEELLESVGLANRRTHRPDALSGGEQQRLSIAVALANNPPLLLADEPTGELDSKTSKDIMNVFHYVNEQYGTTICIVTHDDGIANEVHRVVSIRDGRTSTEIMRSPTFKDPKTNERGKMEEYSVVDSSGRLQIPHKYLDELNIQARAKVNLDSDHVSIWPEGKDSDNEK